MSVDTKDELHNVPFSAKGKKGVKGGTVTVYSDKNSGRGVNKYLAKFAALKKNL